MELQRRKIMNRIKGKSLFATVFLAAALVFTGIFGGIAKPNANAEERADLLYRLEFTDGADLGANSAASGFASAGLQEGNSFQCEEGPKGGKALSFPGETRMVNYLSLPTAMFEGLSAVTIAGWFYLPTGVESYLGEIGIWSESNRAAFRADPFAEYHNGNYMFCVGDPAVYAVEDRSRNNRLHPVYDAWYHMAYAIDGVNHKFTVYQNGAKIFTEDIEEDFTPAEFHADDAHFYLGQSSYENNHNDYRGKMSDIRVYGGALTGEDVKTEYGLKITDFKTAEYTFDTDGSDGVRGYNMAAYGAEPVYEEGVMRLTNGAAVQPYNKDNNHNFNFFAGHTSITVSMDVFIKDDAGVQWKRIMDMFAGGDRITYMAYCPRSGGNYLDAVYHTDGDLNMLSDNSFSPKNKQWTNLTFVLFGSTISVWEDGVKKVEGTNGDKPDFTSFLYGLCNNGGANFTIGNCTYENGNHINADYDNIRIYAAAATTEEEIRAARAGYESYMLRYDANNGTGEKIDSLVRVDSVVTVAQNTFVYEGYRFTGWNTSADGEGEAFAPDAAITVKENAVLYAQWESNSYRIAFHKNGGRGEMPEQLVNFGEETAIVQCAFLRSGYTFAGWATEENGEVVYADGENITPDKDIGLWAVWTAKEYAVSFDANGGEGTMPPQNLTFDTSVCLDANAFTRHGYVFAGWAFTQTGVAVYRDGEEISAIGEGNDVTLYAVWTIGVFTVTFHANGGEGTMPAQTGTAFSYMALPENSFTFTGKKFAGWAKGADGAIFCGDKEWLSLEEDIELWAFWKAEDVTDPGTDEPSTDEPGTDEPDIGSEKPNVGLIVGFTVGGAVVIAVVVAAAVVVKRRK